MAGVWLLLEFIILFFYYDLPMIKPDDEKDQNGYDSSVNGQSGYDSSVNSSVERNLFDKKALHGNTRINESRTDYIISSDTNGDLTSSGAVIDGEKQKLINVNRPGFRKRTRTNSVMENWHLSKGRLRKASYIYLGLYYLTIGYRKKVGCYAVYSQLSLRQTPARPTPTVHLREVSGL